jgi:hypothetical protein
LPCFGQICAESLTFYRLCGDPTVALPGVTGTGKGSANEHPGEPSNKVIRAMSRSLRSRKLIDRLGSQMNSDETAFKSEEKKATHHPSNEQARSAGPGRGSSRGRLVLRSLMGLLAVACIGVAAFAWQSSHGQAAPEPISTSSVPIVKKELAAQPAPSIADVAAKTDAGLPQPSSQSRSGDFRPDCRVF